MTSRNLLFKDFVDALTRAKADRTQALAQLHFRVSTGGEIPILKYDKQYRPIVNKETGEPITTTVVMLPDLRGMERELFWLDREYYGTAPRLQVDVHNEVALAQGPRLKAREMDDLLVDVMRRAKAMGISFSPAIETTAKPVNEEQSQ